MIPELKRSEHAAGGGALAEGRHRVTETGGQHVAPARLANLLHAGFQAARSKLTGQHEVGAR